MTFFVPFSLSLVPVASSSLLLLSPFPLLLRSANLLLFQNEFRLQQYAVIVIVHSSSSSTILPPFFFKHPFFPLLLLYGKFGVGFEQVLPLLLYVV